MEVTTTLTCGSRMYSVREVRMELANSSGVRPLACTSPTSGTEILPSGRTGTEMLKSSLRQTETVITSVAPNMYWSTLSLVSTANARWICSEEEAEGPAQPVAKATAMRDTISPWMRYFRDIFIPLL